MTWREDLRRVDIGGRKLIGASFRGVPFFVDSGDRGGGRRTVVHEFPLRDDPFVEDLGRKARTFRIDGYVLGDDYLSQRDALLAALEDTSGPGELVHPYYGVKRALCTSLSVRETKSDGGIAQFSVEFTETPTQAPVPVEVVDSAAAVSASADAAIAASNNELVAQFNPSGMPAFSLASAETALTNASASLKSMLGPIVTDTQELAQLNSQAALIVAEASSLVRTPALIVGKAQAMIASLATTIVNAPGAVLNALLTAYSLDLGTPVTPTTATRRRELTNQTAIIAALRRVMVIEAARLAPLVPFATIDDATAARDQIALALEDQADQADDAAYPSLVDIRTQVLRAVPGAQQFASVLTVTRKVAIPSLLLAYQLYGSVDLESDVLARNNIRNPAFISGDLKVLSNG